MKRTALFVWGLVMLAIGFGVLGMVVYVMFFAPPEEREERNPTLHIVMGLVIVGGGVYRIGQAFGHFAKAKREAVDDLAAGASTEVGRSPGGSNIIRYERAVPEFVAADMSDSVMEEVCAHLAEHGLEVASVFHEIVSTHVHIDVHVVQPTAERPWITLFTTGMSDLPMSAPEGAEDRRFAELMINLEPSWDLSKERVDDPTNYWPIRLLKMLARFPHEYGTWIWSGHSIPNGDPAEPYAPGTGLSGALLVVPTTLPPDASAIPTSKGEVQMLEIVPVHDDEMQMKLDAGIDALLALFADREVSRVVDRTRPSVLRSSSSGLS